MEGYYGSGVIAVTCNLDRSKRLAFRIFLHEDVALAMDLGDEEDAAQAETDLRLDHKKLFLMAIATSIDALAIGVTFAFLETAILPAIGIIGCTTFCISVAGVAVGCWFGARYKKRAEITGGAILVLLGIKILLEHLGILACMVFAIVIGVIPL